MPASFSLQVSKSFRIYNRFILERISIMDNFLQHGTFIELLQKQTKQQKNKIAFRFFTQEETPAIQLTYGQLFEKVTCLANYLQKLAQPGDRILLILPPGIDYVVSLLACFAAGIVAVPIYPPDNRHLDLSLQIFKTIAADAQTNLVLTNTATQTLFADLFKQQNLSNDFVWLKPETESNTDNHQWVAPNINSQTLAILLYTSGSTGAPKGVMLSHGNLLHDAAIMSQRCQINDQDIFAIWLPPYHVSGIFSGIVLPLFAGAETILFSPQQFLEKPQRWLEIISHYRATMSGSPTFAYDVCAAAISEQTLKSIDLSSWRCAVIGGEPIRKETMDRFSAKFNQYGFRAEAFFSMYGLTESTMISTGGNLETTPGGLSITRKGLENQQAILSDEQHAASLYYVNSGSALPSMTLKIVNPTTFIECHDQEIGEIWLAGGSVAQGYWNKPQETQNTFQAFTQSGEGPFLRSGDLGFIFEQSLYVTGRLKEMIIIRGINYYPDDIEHSVLQSHESLRNAICVAFALDIENEERLVLTLELKQAHAVEEQQALLEKIKSNVARRHGIQVYGIVFLPSGITTLRTTTGKVQRNACKVKVSTGEWQCLRGVVAAQTVTTNSASMKMAIEKTSLLAMSANEAKLVLQGYLQEHIQTLCALDNSSFSINAPIANLGIDSIMMVKLLSQFRTDLVVNIPITCFYDQTTIASLAENILKQLRHGKQNFDNDTVIDFKQEIILDPAINTTGLLTAKTEIHAVLLTGATGFLGAYLLHDLLVDTQSDIYCLVRAADEQQAKQRIIANFNKRFSWREEFNTRVHMVLGELDQPQLGIKPADYAFLTKTISAIYHNGAAVNFVAPYQTLRATNVNSVTEILKLATDTVLKSVHFISTLGVFNSIDRGQYDSLKETDHLLYPENIFGGYAQTKWVAEAVLCEAKQRGVPVFIYRPGLITGDSNNGYMNTDDFLCRFLKSCIQLKAFPDLNIDIDMTPVNYVSKAVVHLSQQSNAQHRIFHLLCPKPIKLAAFVNWIKTEGYPVELVPYTHWLNSISNASTENALYSLIPFVTDKHTSYSVTFLELFAQEHHPLFSQDNAHQQLIGTDIQCAAINANLLNIYFDYFVSIGFLNTTFNHIKEEVI